MNNYWKTVVDTIQDGVMIVDKDGTIVSVNRGLVRMTGYEKAEIVGKPCSFLNCDTCEIARERKGDHWCVLFRTGTMNMRRCTFSRKDGSPVYVLKNASLLRDHDGEVLGAVETMTDVSELVEKDTQIEAFRRELRQEDGFHGILGASAAMQRVFDLIANAARSEAPVIILGESGTGKELAAKAIHDIRGDGDRPFIKVNCASLNPSLLESELFGHVKGAFTGAYRSREGRFAAAGGGDIFLDEIGDLPLSVQVKLLRVLEEKVVERVGDHTPIPINVRILSATNRNLTEMVREGTFREDLFYRINVIPIHMPPLRERPSDIPILADHFFRRIRLKSGKKIPGISQEAMRLLAAYPWPGNVREMKSAFEFAFVSCQDEMLLPRHFPPALFGVVAASPETVPRPLDEAWDKQHRLIQALEAADGNQSEAARILGVSRVTVWHWMKRYQIRFERKLK